jgi:hypothetical protein
VALGEGQGCKEARREAGSPDSGAVGIEREGGPAMKLFESGLLNDDAAGSRAPDLLLEVEGVPEVAWLVHGDAFVAAAGKCTGWRFYAKDRGDQVPSILVPWRSDLHASDEASASQTIRTRTNAIHVVLALVYLFNDFNSDQSSNLLSFVRDNVALRKLSTAFPRETKLAHQVVSDVFQQLLQQRLLEKLPEQSTSGVASNQAHGPCAVSTPNEDNQARGLTRSEIQVILELLNGAVSAAAKLIGLSRSSTQPCDIVQHAPTSTHQHTELEAELATNLNRAQEKISRLSKLLQVQAMSNLDVIERQQLINKPSKRPKNKKKCHRLSGRNRPPFKP